MLTIIKNITSRVEVNNPSKIRFRTMSKKSSKKNDKKMHVESRNQSQLGPISVDNDGNVIIKVQAKPGAKHNNITEIGEDCVGIAISAPPVEGEANTELIKYLAAVLELRKSDVSLDRGSRSRQKMIVVSGITVETVLSKLKEGMKSTS